MGSSGGKGFIDFVLNPVGTVFSDTLGFQADPIGEMISQSFKNTYNVISGEPIQSFFGESFIGDMADPMLGFEGVRAAEATEANTEYWKNFFATGAAAASPGYNAADPSFAPATPQPSADIISSPGEETSKDVYMGTLSQPNTRSIEDPARRRLLATQSNGGIGSLLTDGGGL